MSQFTFLSPESFEPWDYRNPDTVGIGGSETSAIEMAWRLARQNHDVVCYAPIPDGCPANWRGTTWLPLNKASYQREGIWCLYRCPQYLDRLDPAKYGQRAWLICQDEDYQGQWSRDRLDKLERIVTLCQAQAAQFRSRYPDHAHKVCVSSNGLKVELVRQVLAEGHVRDRRRLMYASSPDRALTPLLAIFQRAREFVPDLELHVCYGFNNLDKIVAGITDKVIAGITGKTKRNLSEEQFLAYVAHLKMSLTLPGVTHHGRMAQIDLYREWAKSGLWVYPNSGFRETSCITSMEAQALGAIPVVSPVWAVDENVMGGIAIDGDAYRDPLTQARFAATVVQLVTSEENWDIVRRDLSQQVCARFDWERFVEQWDGWAKAMPPGRNAANKNGNGELHFGNQFDFQHAYARGRILNIGCDTDSSNFKARGATNLDCWRYNPHTKQSIPADIVADVRALPAHLHGLFNTVLLGDILEHFVQQADVGKALEQARACLAPGGFLVITCPEDHRPVEEQVEAEQPMYCDDVRAYHAYPVTRERMEQWLRGAGLVGVTWGKIDYPFTPHGGHGVVAVPAETEVAL